MAGATLTTNAVASIGVPSGRCARRYKRSPGFTVWFKWKSAPEVEMSSVSVGSLHAEPTSARLRAPRVFFGPIVKALTRFLSQLPFTHHPSQDFRWSKRFRTEFAMKIFRDVEPHVESDQIG